MTELTEISEATCRTCSANLAKEEMLSVFGVYWEKSNHRLTIADCLKSFTSVDIEEGDELPTLICRECFKDLGIAYGFKIRCEEVNSWLNEQLIQKKISAGVHSNQSTNAGASLRELEDLKYTKWSSSTNVQVCVNRTWREKQQKSIKPLTNWQADNANIKTELCDFNLPLDNTLKHDNDKTALDEIRKSKSEQPTCKICQKVFLRPSTLARHLRMHTANKSGINRRRTFQCGSCTKVFTSSAGLTYHKQTHMDKIRSFKCEVCNKIFTSNGGLAYHKNVHSGVKNFCCDICNKRFVGHTNLLLHKRRHNREFSHLCSECGKKFLTFGELRRHMRKHTNERPFQCPICQKCFTTNVSLSQHKMRHTGEKPYLCYVCSKRFTTSANLNEHMRSHTGVRPHHCSICSKGCISTSDLKKHLRTHSGEKPYICQECGKGFARSGSLKVHMRTHTGQKPYECSLCGKRFGHSGSLAKHLRKHENAD